MRAKLELFIARLQRENEQLKKMLKTFENDLTEDETDEILSEIYRNLELIKKLEKGL
jgi:hypothetical protein